MLPAIRVNTPRPLLAPTVHRAVRPTHPDEPNEPTSYEVGESETVSWERLVERSRNSNGAYDA